MKRKVLFIVTAICCILLLPSALAADTATVSVANTAVNAGEVAEIAVTISDNPGIAAWMFEVSWDADAFTLETATGLASQGAAFPSGTMLAKQKENGKLTVSWYSIQNVSANGVMFSFRLKANAAASGDYPVTLICSADNTLDSQEHPVSVQVKDGKISVSGSSADKPGSDDPGTDNPGSTPEPSTGNPEDNPEPGKPGTDEPASNPGTVNPSPGTGNNGTGDPETKPDNSGTEEKPPDENGEGELPIENPFHDVSTDAYYYNAVLWAVKHGVTTGTTSTTFTPDDTCTRAQAVTFLWRAAGSPEPSLQTNPFSDVLQGSYYYKAVLWAYENGVTNGTSKSEFSPNGTVTRGQVVTFLYRVAGMEKVSTTNPFSDVDRGEYYYDAVLWAVSMEITNGTSATTFSAADSCTRGQIVTFLKRYYER